MLLNAMLKLPNREFWKPTHSNCELKHIGRVRFLMLQMITKKMLLICPE